MQSRQQLLCVRESLRGATGKALVSAVNPAPLLIYLEHLQNIRAHFLVQ